MNIEQFTNVHGLFTNIQFSHELMTLITNCIRDKVNKHTSTVLWTVHEQIYEQQTLVYTTGVCILQEGV